MTNLFIAVPADKILIKNQLKNIRVRGEIVFVLSMTFLDLLLTQFIHFIFVLFLNDYVVDSRDLFFEINTVYTSILIFGIFASFYETLFLQMIPVVLFKKIGVNDIAIIIVCGLVFSLLHLPHFEKNIELILVLPGGIIYAWSFLKYYQESILKAFFITMSIHGTYNFIVVMSVYYL